MYLGRTTSEAQKAAPLQIEGCRANSSRLPLVLRFAHFTIRQIWPSPREPFGSPQLYRLLDTREDMNILAFGLCLVKSRHLGMDSTDGEEMPNELAFRYLRPSCVTI